MSFRICVTVVVCFIDVLDDGSLSLGLIWYLFPCSCVRSQCLLCWPLVGYSVFSYNIHDTKLYASRLNVFSFL